MTAERQGTLDNPYIYLHQQFTYVDINTLNVNTRNGV